MSGSGYAFKDGSHLTGDPQRVGEELDRIRRTNGGLTARVVWNAARSTKNYLHRYFTWDIRKAAERCWENEARHLIRSVLVQFADDDKPTTTVRAFVAVGGEGDPYVPMIEALSQEQLRSKVLAKAVEELRWFKKK